jgi:hypothetical protein
MRRTLTALAAGTLVLGLAGPAAAIPHPSQGFESQFRNESGTGDGPHCHVMIDNNTPFDTHPVFPSHQGHVASGFGHVFNADLNCDGDAGN